jgi:Anti-sigma-K factor rskA
MTETTSQSQPEPWSELLAGYVLGDLEPAEIAIVDRYLAEHPEQQLEVLQLMLSLDLLPLTLPPDRPPAALKQQIIQIAEMESAVNAMPIVRGSSLWEQAKVRGAERKRKKAQALPTRSVCLRRREGESPRIKLWRIAIAGLGGLIVTGLGWQNYHLSGELATAKQELTNTKLAHNRQKDLIIQTHQSVVSLLQEPNNRLLPLKSMGKKPMGVGSLVMAPQKSSAILTLQQVPSIPQHQVYRVWAIMGDDEMACGDFLPDANGKVLMQLPFGSWKETTKVMITIEDKTAVDAEGEIAIES